MINLARYKNKITRKNLFLLAKDFFAFFKIFILIGLLWIIFSGSTDPFLVFCGIISVVLTFLTCSYLQIFSASSYVVQLSFFRYVYILLRDVVKSTIQVIKIVYSKKIDIDPGLTTLNTEKLSNQEKVLLSNLITMTPGTFVIAVNGDNFLIHALNRKSLNFDDNKEISNLLNKMRNNDEKNQGLSYQFQRTKKQLIHFDKQNLKKMVKNTLNNSFKKIELKLDDKTDNIKNAFDKKDKDKKVSQKPISEKFKNKK